ncbi:uncharacterized protein BDZ99DRAFT_464452 [Mytilinidion resinicola]|uniref:Uncharacterized protein n=1 Tax=Mytilinidion resinicola TaxID=574789 RepID=A0A6A6YJ67_9PEZI|nr:uncharacterized protein BDZ99DRAFT_464452 [Mytilinidion resinicola]KAF2808598.1 hypothetical protein BDZ99DRAFT_464452 [Mytilinidion resinicola]
MTSSKSIDSSLPSRRGIRTVPLPPFPLTPTQPPPAAPRLPTISRLCINNILLITWDRRFVNPWTTSHSHFLRQLYFAPFEPKVPGPLTKEETDYVDFFAKWWRESLPWPEMRDPYRVFPHPFDVESEQSRWRERVEETARRQKRRIAFKTGELEDFGKRVFMGRKKFRSR